MRSYSSWIRCSPVVGGRWWQACGRITNISPIRLTSCANLIIQKASRRVHNTCIARKAVHSCLGNAYDNNWKWAYDDYCFKALLIISVIQSRMLLIYGQETCPLKPLLEIGKIWVCPFLVLKTAKFNQRPFGGQSRENLSDWAKVRAPLLLRSLETGMLYCNLALPVKM